MKINMDEKGTALFKCASKQSQNNVKFFIANMIMNEVSLLEYS